MIIDNLAKYFEKAPMVAYKQPANLRKMIFRAKLFNCTKRSNLHQARKDNTGWGKCGNIFCSFTLVTLVRQGDTFFEIYYL